MGIFDEISQIMGIIIVVVVSIVLIVVAVVILYFCCKCRAQREKAAAGAFNLDMDIAAEYMRNLPDKHRKMAEGFSLLRASLLKKKRKTDPDQDEESAKADEFKGTFVV